MIKNIQLNHVFSIIVFVILLITINAYKYDAIYRELSEHHPVGEHHPHRNMQKWVVNVPLSFEDVNYPHIGHRLTKTSNNVTFINECDHLRSQNPHASKNKAIDFENLYAVENFFWGLEKGLSIELGALDGSTFSSAPSQTALLLNFGWNRILVEANPAHRENMIRLSPESFSVNAAICSEKVLHYLTRNGAKSPASGIVEFMAPLFVGQFFPFLLREGQNADDFNGMNVSWSDIVLPKDVQIVEIACLSLQKVLDRAGCNHINFFILDVEGSEFEVLKSIDWRRTSFDVLCIETEKAYRPDGYGDSIEKYLNVRGYKRYVDKGRNSWFIRNDFIPSKRPECCPVAPPSRHGN